MLKKQKTQNTNKGITLIALVITIIVMLILVAVTITMAVNGGLFEYASNAGAQTNAARDAEQEFANLEADMTVNQLIDKYTGWTGDDTQGGTEIITFTIDGRSYTATNGEKWEEWVLANSGFYVSDRLVFSVDGTEVHDAAKGSQVIAKSSIIARRNLSYKIKY